MNGWMDGWFKSCFKASLQRSNMALIIFSGFQIFPDIGRPDFQTFVFHIPSIDFKMITFQNPAGFHSDFHRYQVNWTPDFIEFSIDDEVVSFLFSSNPISSLFRVLFFDGGLTHILASDIVLLITIALPCLVCILS